MPFPNLGELVEISRRTSGLHETELAKIMHGDELMEMQSLLTQVPVADPLTEYAAALVLSTHPNQAGAPDAAPVELPRHSNVLGDERRARQEVPRRDIRQVRREARGEPREPGDERDKGRSRRHLVS